ncbi:hemolysin family protein [Bacillus manliponensis]|uniref:hemolysin family protein n=1 Tax=Bacillus manliponensis TaxID=574376 RepID=UPI003516FE77
MDIFSISMIIVFIALTAFFVASEFAIVKIRSSRIESLITEGNKQAKAVKTVITNLDEYLAACQLGITITALALGWLGEPVAERMLQPIFMRLEWPSSIVLMLSMFLAFMMITFLHVVIGELVSKAVAIQKAEHISLFIAKPLIVFYHISYPFILILNKSARFVVKLLGLQIVKEHGMVHSEEELRMFVSESYKNGKINQSEYKYVNKIFEFDNRIAKEIMVPRTEIMTLEKNQSLYSMMKIMSKEQYTRYPVIDGDKDHIIGFINFKDIFTDFTMSHEDKEKCTHHYVRPIIQVIESIAIHDLLLKMQGEHTPMAILVDEYGGTSGLVTIEDIIEEIVGDIRDEFDIDERPEIEHISDTKVLLEGKVLLYEVNELLQLSIYGEDVDTISGWILTEYQEIEEGDFIQVADYKFHIIERDGHYIKKIEVSKQRASLQTTIIEDTVSLQEQVSS